MSSGGITTVPEGEVHRTTDARGEEFLATENIESRLESFVRDARLPCENGVSWVKPGEVVRAEDVARLEQVVFKSKNG